jgi:alpha-1,3-fucosyltransferase 10
MFVYLSIDIQSKDEHYFTRQAINVPILVWWTPFTYDTGSYTRCGQSSASCFISNIRKYRDHENFSTFLFYGTDFHLYDLPLPRTIDEQWSLLHEESPKNNFLFSFPSIMNMFNHTATFKRQSDLPLTTQWLQSIDDLLDRTYLIDVEEKHRLQIDDDLAPIIYIQSDCNTPSDRDIYIKELMKFIRIDSYGSCLHNRDLPAKYRTMIRKLRCVAMYESIVFVSTV